MSDGKRVASNNQINRVVGISAVLLLLICAACTFFIEQYFLSENRAEAMEMAQQKARYIDRQLDHGLSVTYALGSLVKIGNGQVGNFDSVAKELLAHYPGVASLQLAPQGVIQLIAPLTGNERAIGHNLLSDELRNKEARLAIDTRRLTLAGPFTLIQGGEAIIGRLPVYMGKSANDFWGFAIALIYLEPFLKSIGLDNVKPQGFAYQLWRIHPDTGKQQIFASSGQALALNPVTTSLEVPNGRWYLSVAPENSWLSTTRLSIEAIFSLLVTTMSCIGIHWYLRTRQRHAEHELRYRSLYEATPAMLHSINADGHIVSVSQTWLDTLGYRREEVIGRKSTDFLTEESRRFAEKDILPKFFQTGSCQDVAYQMVARDGRVLDVLLSAHGERNDEGKFSRSLAVIQDVTERKQTERRLHELLSEQKAIIENDLVGIVRVKDRTIVWANPAFESMLGYGQGELNDVPTQHIYPNEQAYLAFGEAAYPVLRAGEVFHSQFELRHKDGRTVWLNVSGAILDHGKGESLWAFVDISELKLALGRIGRSEQRMELALAGANLGMWDWHIPSGEFVCNRRMLEILGYTSDELTLNNDTYAALINLADMPAVRETLFHHFRGETAMFEAEYRARHKDDHWVWLLCRGKVVERDADGRALRMTGTNLDISERKASEELIKSRESRLANLIASMQDLVVVFDAGGSVVEYFYPSAGRHPFQLATDPRGGNYVESLPTQIANRFVAALGEVVLDGNPRSLEYTLAVNGEPLISVATLSAIMDDAEQFPSGFLAIIRDVTSERLYQREIEHLNHRNTVLLESAGEGIFGADPAGITTFVNSTALAMLGLSETEVIGQPSHELFHHHHENGEEYPAGDCPIYKTLRDGKHRYSDSECFWRKDGRSIPVSLNVAPIIEDGENQGAVVVFQDITERRRSDEAIRHLAFYDPLTQLPNRRLLTDRLNRALVASKRSELYGALFFIDLDNFKNLNDSLGHDVGDLLLQQVATRLLDCVRESDTVARFGGDEFVLLCEGLGTDASGAEDHIEDIGKKILAALNEPYCLAAHTHISTPSIGVSLFRGSEKSADELLKEADIAMYQAKQAGRNRMQVFSPEANATA